MSKLNKSNQINAIKSISDWEKFRQKVLSGMQDVMGQLPSRAGLPKPEFQIIEEYNTELFNRFNISIPIEENDHIPAYLFIPKNKSCLPSPAILALHQTTPIGKDEPAGLGGNSNLHYALEMARRGYVVLAPDFPSFGEYKDYDFSKDNYVSGTMKGIFNHMRCIDYLQSLPEVIADKIAVIGHSLGGHNAIFVGAFDNRIKAVVASCAWTPFHYYYGGKLDGWTSDRYMPRIRTAYNLDPDKVPFDFDGAISSLAPRAFFSNSPINDANFDFVGVKAVMPLIERIYSLFEALDKLKVFHPDCQHSFPSSIRFEAYRFIDKILEFHSNYNKD